MARAKTPRWRNFGLLLAGLLLAAIFSSCGSGSRSQASPITAHEASATSESSGGGARFPRSVYPPAHHPSKPWGDPEKCPNATGVQSLLSESPNRRIAALLGKLTGKPADDERYADRAFWPALKDNYIPGPVYRGKHAPPYEGQRLSATSNAAFVKTHCGGRIEQRSWSFVFTQSRKGHREHALESAFYLLRRQGHWLVWFLA